MKSTDTESHEREKIKATKLANYPDKKDTSVGKYGSFPPINHFLLFTNHGIYTHLHYLLHSEDMKVLGNIGSAPLYEVGENDFLTIYYIL